MRLDEFTEDEWWDLCRQVRPDMAEAEFRRDWQAFLELQAEHEARAKLN